MIYKIRATREEETGRLMTMFEHSRSIMRNNGNKSQWVGGYPTERLVREDIGQGVSYVVEENGEAVGTFAFIIGKDPTYNIIEGGHWEEDARPYGTLHRMACMPGHRGIFEASVEWCRKQITSLRADTHEDNGIMKHLLEKHGFKYRGTIYIADGTPRKAYQMLDTKRVCEPMKEYIERAILPQYDAFDSAHKRDHAETVIRNSIELSQYYPVEINMVYVIAAYHDTGLSVSRKWHHIISKENILKDNELSRWFYKNQIEIMAQAVEDHRASSGIEPRSIYGKIIAEADRDIEPLKIIQRTVQYGLSNYPELDKESQWERAKEHLKEKYGKGGYLKLWLPESSNAIKLKELREIIVDEERLRHLFEVYFDKNNNDNKRN